jgi:hypothetical protein
VRREIEHAYNLNKTMIPIFQESYADLRQMPDEFVESLLQSDGIQILDTKNVFIDESVEQLARMILKTAPRKRRSVLPLAVIGLVVLVAAGGGFALLSANRVEPTPTSTPTSAPTEAPVESPVPPPTTAFTPTFSPTPGCPFALPVRLTAGGKALVRTDDPRDLNVRLGPSTDFRVAEQIPPGETFDVLEGPQCSGSYAWYRVRYGDLEGWIAEGDTSYFVEPFVPTATPSPSNTPDA